MYKWAMTVFGVWVSIFGFLFGGLSLWFYYSVPEGLSSFRHQPWDLPVSYFLVNTNLITFVVTSCFARRYTLLSAKILLAIGSLGVLLANLTLFATGKWDYAIVLFVPNIFYLIFGVVGIVMRREIE